MFVASVLGTADERIADKLAAFRPVRSTVTNLRSSGPRSVLLLAGDEAETDVLTYAANVLVELGIPFTRAVVGNGLDRGRRIAAAMVDAAAVVATLSGAEPLAFAAAESTALPVLAVPVVAVPVERIDDFVEPFRRLPRGVAAFAVGKPGAVNAGLFAATILSAPGTRCEGNLNRNGRTKSSAFDK